MENTIFTQPVRKTDNCILVVRLTDKGTHLIEQTDVFTNRKKVYEFLTAYGTVYASRHGNNFNKPLLTYKTFTEHLKKTVPLIVHIAGTGVFAGRYYIRIQKMK